MTGGTKLIVFLQLLFFHIGLAKKQSHGIWTGASGETFEMG